MMDFKEFYLIENFDEVLPHLDDTVRKIILEERVPYAARPQQQTISAGSLVIPRMLPVRAHQLPNYDCIGATSSKVTYKLGKMSSTTIVSKFKPGFKPVVKKRRALPYEKYCASMSGIEPLFTGIVDKHIKASAGLQSRYSNIKTYSRLKNRLQSDTCTQTEENSLNPADRETDRMDSDHCPTCQKRAPERAQSNSASEKTCSNVVKTVAQTTSLQITYTSSKCVCKTSSSTVEEVTQLQTKPTLTGTLNTVTACSTLVEDVTQLQTKPSSTGTLNTVTACSSIVADVTQLQTKPSLTGTLNTVTACSSIVEDVTQLQTKTSSTGTLKKVTSCSKSVQTYLGKRKRTCSNDVHAIGEGTSLNSRRISSDNTAAFENSVQTLQEASKYQAGRISFQADQSRNNADLNDAVAVRVRPWVGAISLEADQSLLEATSVQSKHISTCDRCCPNFGKTFQERTPLPDKLISTDNKDCSNPGKSWQETVNPISDSDQAKRKATSNAAQITQEYTPLAPQNNLPHINPKIPSNEARIVKQTTSQRSTANAPTQLPDVSYPSLNISSQRTMVTPSTSGKAFSTKMSSVDNTGLTATATSLKSEENSDVKKTRKKPIEIGMMNEAEIEAMIQTLVSAQNIYAPFPANPREDADKEHEKEITTRVAGDMATHAKPGTESKKLTFSYGAKKENLKDTLMASVVSYFEKKILETVQFAKRIPGFLKLPRDDQANLIKESRNESDLISAMRCFNQQDNSFVSLEGDHYTFQDLSSILSEDTVQIYVEGGMKVAKLNASLEEAALLRAITITFADRCELICRDEVEDIQNRLITCLIHVVKKGSLPTGKRIGQLFDFLLFCRNVTDIALKNLK